MPELLSDPLADYNAAQLLRVAMLLIDLAARRQGARLLVLDDGAYFVRGVMALQSLGHPAGRAFEGSFVVEQTTRGHRFLTANQHQICESGMRVVSVARSHTKIQFEGPFIGASVANAVSQQALLRSLTPQRVAVLGFGVVGEATARELQTSFPAAELVIVDSRREARTRASAAIPAAVVVDSVLDRGGYDLVVGCTGQNSFTVADRATLAPRSLLASASSAAVEFDRTGLIELADALDDDEIVVLEREATRASGIHASITLSFEGGRHMTILNGGFPVNFDGQRECLPVKMIQPTRCLMFAGAHQVVNMPAPGIEPLNFSTDIWIYHSALDSLGG